MPPPLQIDTVVHRVQICNRAAKGTKIFSAAGGTVREAERIMKIEQEEKGGTGRHFINDELGDTIGEITYSVGANKVLIIDHTGVNDDMQGKNIGQDLVQSVVEQARAEGKKIHPVCTFAKAVLERTSEYADVLVAV